MPVYPISLNLTLLSLTWLTRTGLKTTGNNAVSRETVTLAHFLDVADAVVGPCRAHVHIFHFVLLLHWLRPSCTQHLASPSHSQHMCMVIMLATSSQQVRHTEQIKQLDAQAQGEALIRKALAELKVGYSDTWVVQRSMIVIERLLWPRPEGRMLLLRTGNRAKRGWQSSPHS